MIISDSTESGCKMSVLLEVQVRHRIGLRSGSRLQSNHREKPRERLAFLSR